MFTTHLLIGVVIAIVYDPSLIFIIIAGSVFPDIDILFSHRRTAHAPFVFLISSLIVYIISPLSFVFLFMCSLHSFIDILGSKSMEPWKEESTNKSVYNHISEKWIVTETIIYDGSKEDFILSTILLIPIIILANNSDIIIFSILFYIIGLFYTIFRKRFVL